MKKVFFLGLLLLSSLPLLAGKIKIIDLSWHCPNIDFLEQHLEELEKDTVFDGLTIAFYGKYADPQKRNYRHSFRDAWCNDPWTYEEFEDFIARYNKLNFQKCKHNFLYLTTNDARFSWQSDEDWKCLANNFAIAARIAKETGMKGFLFDIEQYGIKFWPYDETKGKLPFKEMEKIVYARGQQWGRAVFAVYPDICLLMPYGLSGHDKPTSLINAFMNGIIDAMTPGARIYEGDEGKSYHAGTLDQFRALRTRLYEFQTKETYFKNRKKAQAQYKLAPGLYMDAFFLLPIPNYYVKCPGLKPGQKADRVKLFTESLNNAMTVADDYVWFYGEKRCWWPHSQHPKAEYNQLWQNEPEAKDLVPRVLQVKAKH